MSREDYAHWNEEADIVWWQEEGRHSYEGEFSDFEDDHDAWDDYDDWADEEELVEI